MRTKIDAGTHERRYLQVYLPEKMLLVKSSDLDFNEFQYVNQEFTTEFSKKQIILKSSTSTKRVYIFGELSQN